MAQQNGNSNIRRCGSLVRQSCASLDNEEDSDDCVSMDDFLSEQERLQADADAVLGGSDENNCTYPQGYLQRQALYACSTCTPEGNAGVCLACSYACHEGHELYELYTKRNFSCDCGNEKFTNNPCQLFKEPKGLNARNHYNQNFRGLYCSCSRPYPDPEDKIQDEMIQCILCEDWHHGRHLNVTVPEDFEEMICPSCMSKFSFLWLYASNLYASNIKDEVIANETDNIVVVDEEPAKTKEEVDLFVQSQKRSRPEESDKNFLHEAASSKKAKLDDSLRTEVCLLKSLESTTKDCPDQAVFWKAGWRHKLCRCTSCMDMYKDKSIEFIIDETDTVHSYEEKGRSSSASRASEPVDVTDALKGMNRVQQIEVVQGFLDLKSELNEFLQGFARDQKIVTESDIREFFQHMDNRRKERLHLPQDNCR